MLRFVSSPRVRRELIDSGDEAAGIASASADAGGRGPSSPSKHARREANWFTKTCQGAPLGVYHLPRFVDVVNVRIDADGTFRYLLSGGDYGSAELGRWSVDARRARSCRGQVGRASSGVGLEGARTVEKVLVRAGANADELIVIAEDSQGREEQSWKRGGICRRSEPNAVNGYPFRKEPCEDPFESRATTSP